MKIDESAEPKLYAPKSFRGASVRGAEAGWRLRVRFAQGAFAGPLQALVQRAIRAGRAGAVLATVLASGGCSSKPPAPPAPAAVEEAARLAQQAGRYQADRNWTAAAEWWHRAGAQYQLLNQIPNAAVAWHNEGIARREVGDLKAAQELIARAAEANAALGQHEAWWRNQLALLQIENQVAPDRAAERLEMLQASPLETTDPRMRGLWAHEAARVWLRRGDTTAAFNLLAEARQQFHEAGDAGAFAAAGVTLARILRAQGRLAASEEIWRESLQIYEGLAMPRGIATALAGLGSCLAAQDEAEARAEARALLERAAQNLRALGLEDERAAVAEELASLDRAESKAGP
jgi:tetratricopeptide (TPR) repeat protein